MRFIFFTDSHIRGTNPRNRKDNFQEALKEKFLEIRSLCNELDIDYIIHGGDWFDRPDVSPAIVKEFAVIIKSFNRPVYTIAGNHDIFGHNPDTVGRTMLGILEGVGIISLLDFNSRVILEKEKVKVQLTGRPYRYDIDGEAFRDYYIVEKLPGIDYAINVIHSMLLVKPFFQGIHYTLLEDIKDTQADITLAGHYHSGFGIEKRCGRYFVNPGSLARVTNTIGEMTRTPKVVLIELNETITLKEIELKCARRGEEVLDREIVEKAQDRLMKLQQFYNELSSTTGFSRVDLNRIIEEIASNEDLESQVKEEALRRISQARENLSEDDDGT